MYLWYTILITGDVSHPLSLLLHQYHMTPRHAHVIHMHHFTPQGIRPIPLHEQDPNRASQNCVTCTVATVDVDSEPPLAPVAAIMPTMLSPIPICKCYESHYWNQIWLPRLLVVSLSAFCTLVIVRALHCPSLSNVHLETGWHFMRSIMHIMVYVVWWYWYILSDHVGREHVILQHHVCMCMARSIRTCVHARVYTYARRYYHIRLADHINNVVHTCPV